MSATEVNLITNVIVIVINVGISLFPVYWLRTHNHDYKDGLRLIAPALTASVIGSILFLVLYFQRINGYVNDEELQKYARLVLMIFLFVPSSLVLSLHNWKK